MKEIKLFALPAFFFVFIFVLVFGISDADSGKRFFLTAFVMVCFIFSGVFSIALWIDEKEKSNKG